jgi:hypothetical protein
MGWHHSVFVVSAQPAGFGYSARSLQRIQAVNDEIASPTAAQPGSVARLQIGPAPRARRPSLTGCLLAHWRYIFCPHRAAGALVTANAWQAAAAVVLALVEVNAAVLTVIGEPLADAWPVIVLVVLAFAWMAWVQLPHVHRAGLLGHSYWRSVCACSGAMGFVIAEAIAVGVFAATLHGAVREAEGFDALLAMVAAALALRWFGLAAGGAPGIRVPQRPPPVCERCGYDLTHRPADGRCPECGFDIAKSLTPQCPRAGGRGAHDRSASAWAAATGQIVFRPGRFYKRLALRGGAAREHAFARWTYRAIALGAMAWVTCLIVYSSVLFGAPRDFRVFVAGGVFSLGAAVGCWAGHRTIAVGVFMWWAVLRPLPDGRWAAKVIAYESAFLWVFCTFWGVLATSFMVFDQWISRGLAPGLRWVLGAPAEFWVVVLGTCGLGAGWLWRYRVAYRAIRWSNF